MNRMLRLIILSCVCAVNLNLQSCSSDESDPNLSEILITSSNGFRLDLGEVTQLTAEGRDQNNKLYDISSSLSWSVNNSNVGVDANGKVTALVVGNSTVTATAEGITKSVPIEVWDSTEPRIDVFVSDAGNFDQPPWQILKYDENGEFLEVFINTHLGWPQDIVFLENDGVMLVSNLNNGDIVKFDIDTGDFLGTFASGIGGPTRMKIGPDDLLYVLQWQGNGKVRRYELDGTFVDEFTSVGVNESIGLDWDAVGNLYVSSFNSGTNGYVRKFDVSGNDQGKFIETNLSGPTNIWFDESGNLFVNDWQAGAIRKFDADGVFLGNFVTGLALVEGIDFLDNGDLLVGNGGTAAVKQFTAAGTFVKDFIPNQSGGLIKPNAVVLRRVNY